MELRELGNSGVQVAEVGLGTWRYRGGVDPLRRGIELGARLIDTAEVYGSEEVVGQALVGVRDTVFLATKVSGEHLRYDQVLQAAEGSLKRLGTKTIDLYQVHSPNPRVPIVETMRALETLADEGTIRFIGVSNFSRRQLEDAQACLKRHTIVANQVRYNLLDRRIEKDLDFYERNRISVLAYSPLDEGAIFAREQRVDLVVLRAIAQQNGKTVAQVALNWCLRSPAVIVIPKTDHAGRVDDLCGASGWRLDAGQIADLDRVFS